MPLANTHESALPHAETKAKAESWWHASHTNLLLLGLKPALTGSQYDISVPTTCHEGVKDVMCISC